MKNQQFLTFVSPSLVVILLAIVLAFTQKSNLTVVSIASASQNVSNTEYLEMTKKGEDLIKKQILTPVKIRMGITANGKAFSRCPSGIAHYVMEFPTVKESKHKYFQGKVVNYVGCSDIEICSFRMDKDETILEIYEDSKKQYIPAETWLTIHNEDLKNNPKYKDPNYQENQENIAN
ncbi:MAG: hypothetical protein EAZ55_00440 [Cytophagales bacterium]|nr:MAG: hypothetical protein EAZ55_00440 [Cytophagales bacterium]